jgi:hypothetical protein
MNHADHLAAVLGLNPHGTECDNCYTQHFLEDFAKDPCALQILFAWAVHSDRMTADEALARVSKISPDMLWDRLGDLLDDLVAGDFNYEE